MASQYVLRTAKQSNLFSLFSPSGDFAVTKLSLDSFGQQYYRVSHSEMIDSKWLWEVEGLRIFLNYGG